jgi:hypothetical protein
VKGNARSDISFRICVDERTSGWSWGSGWRSGLGTWGVPRCRRYISLRCRPGTRHTSASGLGTLQTPLHLEVPLVDVCAGSSLWLRVMHTSSLVASQNVPLPYHISYRPQAQRHNSSPIWNNNGSIWSGSRRLILPLRGPSPRHLGL